jgi:hypothetical protein
MEDTSQDKHVDKHTREDAAKWKIERVTTYGRLKQRFAATDIRTRFGDEFVYLNENQHVAIAKSVLQAFRTMGHGTIIWNRKKRYWHLARPVTVAE